MGFAHPDVHTKIKELKKSDPKSPGLSKLKEILVYIGRKGLSLPLNKVITIFCLSTLIDADTVMACRPLMNSSIGCNPQ